jgi:choline dehydrogenase-like flavoprotein
MSGDQINLSRGRFLGGSSGVNGTLCIRGAKQDYDDWNLPGWSGDEFFAAMRKAETFHSKVSDCSSCLSGSIYSQLDSRGFNRHLANTAKMAHCTLNPMTLHQYRIY